MTYIQDIEGREYFVNMDHVMSVTVRGDTYILYTQWDSFTFRTDAPVEYVGQYLRGSGYIAFRDENNEPF